MNWILIVMFLLPGASVDAVVIENFPSQEACRQAGEQIVKDLGPRMTAAKFSCVSRG